MGKKKAAAATRPVTTQPRMPLGASNATTQQNVYGGNVTPPGEDAYLFWPQENIDIYKLVDSWRSYRNDTTNLQSIAGDRPSYQGQDMNVQAAPFVPFQHASGMQHSHFVPHQPLRISNGSRERLVLQKFSGEAGPVPSQLPPRYSLRSRDPADKPLPSIERAESTQPSQSNQRHRYFPRPDSVPRRSTPRGSTPRRTVSPPPAPIATEMYLHNGRLTPELRPTSRKLLVILDLNGTLIVRPNSREPTSFKLRPGVTSLLDYLFENHTIMVYTSAQPQNALVVIEKLLHPKFRQKLAAVWCRDRLGLTLLQYNNKVQVYKQLKPVWADQKIQSTANKGEVWNQSNTVLVDDSHLKALSEPHNLLQIPEFLNNAPREDEESLRKWQRDQMAIMKSIQEKLELLKWQVDVSRLIYKWQTGEEVVPGVVDERIDQKPVPEQLVSETDRKVDAVETASKPKTSSLPSPESIADFLRINMSQHLSVVDEESETTSGHPITGRNSRTKNLADDDELDDQEKDEVDGGVALEASAELSPPNQRNERTTSESTDRVPSNDISSSMPSSAYSRTRSVSPIDDDIWSELLGGAVGKDAMAKQ